MTVVLNDSTVVRRSGLHQGRSSFLFASLVDREGQTYFYALKGHVCVIACDLTV